MQPADGNANRRVLNHAWSIDEAQVYFRGKPLKHADAATFAVINDMFARDSQHIYSAAGPAKLAAHAPSFEALDSGRSAESNGSIRYQGYARDASKVYFADAAGGMPRAIAGADPKSFRSAGHGFAFDARHVYCVGWRVKGVKSAGFELLNSHHARTADAVIFGGGRIEDAIPQEFKVLDDFRGRDSKQTYAYGRPEEKPAFSIGGYGIRFQRRSGGSGVFGTLLLLLILIGGLFVWLFEKLTWWRHRDEETAAAADPEASAKVRRLAESLANGDEQALKPVLLAIDDMPAFVEQYGGRESFADEPQYAELIGNSDGEPTAYEVLTEVYLKRGLLGLIDWRSATDETMPQVDRMLDRLGVRNFDWGFIDTLEEHGDGSELRNNNFLSILRDRLRTHGLTLAHIDQLGDSYGFAVLRLEDFAAIDGLKVENEFAVLGDFGDDEAYERGKRILADHPAS